MEVAFVIIIIIIFSDPPLLFELLVANFHTGHVIKWNHSP